MLEVKVGGTQPVGGEAIRCGEKRGKESIDTLYGRHIGVEIPGFTGSFDC